MILVSIKTLHEVTHIPMLQDHIRSSYKTFHDKLCVHTNKLIQNVDTVYMPENIQKSC